MNRLFSVVLPALFLAAPSAADAARIRGTVRLARAAVPVGSLGYTVTQIAAPAKSATDRKAPVAFFLKVKTSLPLPPPEAHQTIRVRGLELVPPIASCAVDGKVIIENVDPTPMTIQVGGHPLGTLAPNESKEYACTEITNGRAGDVRTIHVKEWPHLSGAVYVGEIGLVTTPKPDGDFEVNAPKGQYVLEVIGRDGSVVATRDVDVQRSDVDLGTIDLRSDAEKQADTTRVEDRPEAAPPPPPPPKVKRPPPPVEEEEEEDEGDEVP